MLRFLAVSLLVIGVFPDLSAAEVQVLIKGTEGEPLADAVVVVKPLPGTALGTVSATESGSERPRATIQQIDKQFEPYVSVVQKGTVVDFPNRDSILHNVYSFSKAKPFQLPLYRDKPPEPVVFDKPGVVTLGCNIHDWMVAYVYVVDTAFFAKTGSDGEALLAALPGGEFEVRVWHPRKKRRGSSPTRRIRLEPNESQRAEFTVALKPEWRPRRPPELE